LVTTGGSDTRDTVVTVQEIVGIPRDTAVVNTDHRPGDYEIVSDLARMDLDRVHRWLSTDAYWALGRARDTVETAARHSLNFGAFTGDGGQVAYARVVTDHATFAWLCDVYVDRNHRGRGLGRRLAETVVARLRPLRLKRVLLATLDAHEVYARAGFVPMPDPDLLMILGEPDSEPTVNRTVNRQ
jgi:GNAT superfamily N-acetyltransferase